MHMHTHTTHVYIYTAHIPRHYIHVHLYGIDILLSELVMWTPYTQHTHTTPITFGKLYLEEGDWVTLQKSTNFSQGAVRGDMCDSLIVFRIKMDL